MSLEVLLLYVVAVCLLPLVALVVDMKSAIALLAPVTLVLVIVSARSSARGSCSPRRRNGSPWCSPWCWFSI